MHPMLHASHAAPIPCYIYRMLHPASTILDLLRAIGGACEDSNSMTVGPQWPFPLSKCSVDHRFGVQDLDGGLLSELGGVAEAEA